MFSILDFDYLQEWKMSLVVTEIRLNGNILKKSKSEKVRKRISKIKDYRSELEIFPASGVQILSGKFFNIQESQM